jgi:hypothetical protein
MENSAECDTNQSGLTTQSNNMSNTNAAMNTAENCNPIEN